MWPLGVGEEEEIDLKDPPSINLTLTISTRNFGIIRQKNLSGHIQEK